MAFSRAHLLFFALIIPLVSCGSFGCENDALSKWADASFDNSGSTKYELQNECDVQGWGTNIAIVAGIPIVIGVLLCLCCPLFFCGRACCDCCGGKDPSEGCCIPRDESERFYMRRTIIASKICIAIFATLAVVGGGITVFGAVGMSTHADSFFDVAEGRKEFLVGALDKVIRVFDAANDVLARSSDGGSSNNERLDRGPIDSARSTIRSIDVAKIRDVQGRYEQSVRLTSLVLSAGSALVLISACIAGIACNARSTCQYLSAAILFLFGAILSLILGIALLLRAASGEACGEVILFENQSENSMILTASDRLCEGFSFAKAKATMETGETDLSGHACTQTQTSSMCQAHSSYCTSNLPATCTHISNVTTLLDIGVPTNVIGLCLDNTGGKCKIGECARSCVDTANKNSTGLVQSAESAGKELLKAKEDLEPFLDCQKLMYTLISPFAEPCEAWRQGMMVLVMGLVVLVLAVVGGLICVIRGIKRFQPLEECSEEVELKREISRKNVRDLAQRRNNTGSFRRIGTDGNFRAQRERGQRDRGEKIDRPREDESRRYERRDSRKDSVRRSRSSSVTEEAGNPLNSRHKETRRDERSPPRRASEPAWEEKRTLSAESDSVPRPKGKEKEEEKAPSKRRSSATRQSIVVEEDSPQKSKPKGRKGRRVVREVKQENSEDSDDDVEPFAKSPQRGDDLDVLSSHE